MDSSNQFMSIFEINVLGNFIDENCEYFSFY